MRRTWSMTAALGILVYCILSVVLVLMYGCASAPRRPDFSERKGYDDVILYLNGYIEQSMRKSGITGLSIALVDDQRIVWARGFGYADSQNEVKATENTVYRVGSISKVFTASAVMQLAEQGKIDIDRPIQTYLPEFSIRSRFKDAGPITPRNIMTHHSGIPSDYLHGMFCTNPESLENFTARIRDEYTASPPGMISSYSNVAMTVLGRMVEKVGVEPFPEYMDAHLLKPMGMTGSSFVMNDTVRPFASKGYFQGKEQKQYAIRDMPAGSLYSNVTDLGRFLQVVFADGRSKDKVILKPETLREMLRVQNADTPLDLDMTTGLNWSVLHQKHMGTIIGHDGGTTTFFSVMTALYEHKLGVVVLTNCVEGSQAINMIAQEALESMIEMRTGKKLPEPEPLPPVTRLDPKTAARYTGAYDTMMGLVTISPRRSGLCAKTSQGSFLLVPLRDGTFSLKYLLAGFIPVSIGGEPFDRLCFSFTEISGYPVVVAHAGKTDRKRILFGTRLTAPQIPASWSRRVGRYVNTDREDEGIAMKALELKIEDGFLVAYVTMHDVKEDTARFAALQPMDDTEAVVMGLGRDRGITCSFISRDGKEYLHVMGYDLEPVKK
ncbi:MAG TPA: serine hydrolase domain-containing protein [Desulfomonilia bacterium]|nr:serine hydrolase domain-containing protein [Desulfomonilia bacterium]